MRNNHQPDIMKLASGKWPSILTSMGIDEAVVSGKHGPCPMCGGKDRFRMISKDGPARWICNQCGSGDGMDLLMAFRGCDFHKAANDIRPIVGGCMYAEPPKAITKDERRRRVTKNVNLWKQAFADHTILIEYLSHRGIREETFRGADLKLHPRLEYYDDEGKQKGTFPAMLARVATRDNKLAAIHRTYLYERNQGDVVTSKKITVTSRDWKGGAIKLFSVKDQDTLIIAEGIETALSMRQMYFDKHGKWVPCWAAVNANAMERVAIPEHITEVIIGADNDSSFTGQKAAFTLANRLRVHDKRNVTVAIPDEVDTDWNDKLKEKANG